MVIDDRKEVDKEAVHRLLNVQSFFAGHASQATEMEGNLQISTGINTQKVGNPKRAPHNYLLMLSYRSDTELLDNGASLP